MADTAEAVQNIVKSGLEPAYTGSLATDNTYQTPNDGKTFLHIVNGGGSSDTVTVLGLDASDNVAVAVPAGEERMIGPFEPAKYNTGAELIEYTHSFITSVTQAALHLS